MKSVIPSTIGHITLTVDDAKLEPLSPESRAAVQKWLDDTNAKMRDEIDMRARNLIYFGTTHPELRR